MGWEQWPLQASAGGAGGAPGTQEGPAAGGGGAGGVRETRSSLCLRRVDWWGTGSSSSHFQPEAAEQPRQGTNADTLPTAASEGPAPAQGDPAQNRSAEQQPQPQPHGGLVRNAESQALPDPPESAF